MTRKSKRGLKRELEEIGATDAGDDAEGIHIIYRDARTGDHYADEDFTEPVDLGELSGLCIEIARGVVVMSREKAERNDEEIIEPAKDAPADDAVRVWRGN